ncbi:MAG: DNA-processing protein DprA [Clostridiales bacterium]|nr:DNA-processing protein DprA [Clostridiales bacterium]
MNSNSLVTILLCSHLSLKADDRPLEPREWSNLVNLLIKSDLQPKTLLDFSEKEFSDLGFGTEETKRYLSLLKRSSTITFELEKFSRMGIEIVTRSDKEYPNRLKAVLKNTCPPLFYSCGDYNVYNRSFIGFVGSRSTEKKDEDFTKTITNLFVEKGFGIVTGGANGVDQTASLEAINNGGLVIEYLSNGLLQKIKSREYIHAIRDGRLLLLSTSKPDAGFNAGIAMMRNKYIYAQSTGTIVVKSDYKKGGTWAGATENLKNKWCKEYCWADNKYPGNAELIKQGAIPIDSNWDGNLEIKTEVKIEKGEQISLW